MPSSAHSWEFTRRLRPHTFGWKGSRAAIERIDEALLEIRSVARTDQMTAAEGAIVLIERLSPALEQVDSSSGALGTAVNRAIAALVPIIAAAPADAVRRASWLERLWTAHELDEIPYIESLGDHWGVLCASRDLAAEWADRLVGTTRLALSPDPAVRGYFFGTSACLSALFSAGRYDEIVDVLRGGKLWDWKQWAVKALVAQGDTAAALRYAESCRDPWTPDEGVDRVCEEILLSSGMVDDAYTRYGLRANRRGTYLATFRAVAKKYPGVLGRRILDDLVATTPGEEGKWFAAAKAAGFRDEALALARRSPCDPRTLIRAARDFAQDDPPFAVGAGLLALSWIVRGHGFDIAALDVLAAYSTTLNAAEAAGTQAETHEALKRMVLEQSEEAGARFVRQVLEKELNRPFGRT